MENSVQIDMKNWSAVGAEHIVKYFRSLHGDQWDNENALNFNEDAQKSAEAMAAWCGFDRSPQNLGELLLVDRFYYAFQTLVLFAEVEKGDRSTWAQDRREKRKNLFASAERECPALIPALQMREAEQYGELCTWLVSNDVLKAWSTKPSGVFRL